MTTCTENRSDLRLSTLKETAEALLTAAVLMPQADADHVVDRDLRLLYETADGLVARLGLHAAGLVDTHPSLFEAVSA